MSEHWSETLEVGDRFTDKSGHTYEVLETGLTADRSVNPSEWHGSRTAYQVKCLTRGREFKLSATMIKEGAVRTSCNGVASA